MMQVAVGFVFICAGALSIFFHFHDRLEKAEADASSARSSAQALDQERTRYIYTGPPNPTRPKPTPTVVGDATSAQSVIFSTITTNFEGTPDGIRYDLQGYVPSEGEEIRVQVKRKDRETWAEFVKIGPGDALRFMTTPKDYAERIKDLMK